MNSVFSPAALNHSEAYKTDYSGSNEYRTSQDELKNFAEERTANMRTLVFGSMRSDELLVGIAQNQGHIAGKQATYQAENIEQFEQISKNTADIGAIRSIMEEHVVTSAVAQAAASRCIIELLQKLVQ